MNHIKERKSGFDSNSESTETHMSYENAITIVSDSMEVRITKGFRRHLMDTMASNLDSKFGPAFDLAINNSDQKKESFEFYRKAFLSTYDVDGVIFVFTCREILHSHGVDYEGPLKERLYFCCARNGMRFPQYLKESILAELAREKRDNEQKAKLKAYREELLAKEMAEQENHNRIRAEKQRLKDEEEEKIRRAEEEKKAAIQRYLDEQKQERLRIKAEKDEITYAHLNMTKNQEFASSIRLKKYNARVRAEQKALNSKDVETTFVASKSGGRTGRNFGGGGGGSYSNSFLDDSSFTDEVGLGIDLSMAKMGTEDGPHYSPVIVGNPYGRGNIANKSREFKRLVTSNKRPYMGPPNKK